MDNKRRLRDSNLQDRALPVGMASWVVVAFEELTWRMDLSFEMSCRCY